jgi:hypothetical protein
MGGGGYSARRIQGIDAELLAEYPTKLLAPKSARVREAPQGTKFKVDNSGDLI